jgi:hypothetical protein
MEIKSKFRFITLDWRLNLILILYTILGYILLSYFQYQINPDGVGYITTAEIYLSGNVYNAVNAYWGPLLSWLLIPLLYFNQTPTYALYAAKILSLIIGFITIIGVRQLSYNFEMKEYIRTASLIITVPAILYFALTIITPDLLIVCFLVYYFAIIFNSNYPDKLSNGLLCGAIAAFAYTGKSFIFPFFIVHYIIMNIIHHYRVQNPEQKKRVTKNLILGLTIFLVISGVWVGLISSKEGYLTYGTAGSYNYELVGPQSNGFPQFNQGLTAPGEINEEQALKPWSPFSSTSNFQYQLKIIWDNIKQTYNIFQYFSFLSILILLSYLILNIRLIYNWFVNKKPNQKEQQNLLYPLITIIIYAGGYLPVLVEDRYLWPIYILLILMGGYLINQLFKIEIFKKLNYYLKSTPVNILKGVIILIFVFSFITMPINELHSNLNTGKGINSLSNTLKTQYDVHGSVATNDQLLEIQFICFYLNTTSYGQASQNIDDKTLTTQLKKYNIDYYFVWGNSLPHNLTGYHEITNGKIQNLMIYTKN